MSTFPPDDSEYFYKPLVGAYVPHMSPTWSRWEARMKEITESMKPENMYITAAKALAKCFDIDVRKAVIGPDGSVYLRTIGNEIYQCVVRDELKETRLALVSWIATKRIPDLIALGLFS